MTRVDDVTRKAATQVQEDAQQAKSAKLTEDEQRKLAEQAVAQAALAAQQLAEATTVQDGKKVDESKEVDKVELKKDTRLTGYKENIAAQDLATQKAAKEEGVLTIRDLLKQEELRRENQDKIKA